MDDVLLGAVATSEHQRARVEQHPGGVVDGHGQSLGYIAVHTPKSDDLNLNLSTAISDTRTQASVPVQSP